MRYKAILFAMGMMTAPSAFSQSIDEGKKMLYYGRLESAKDIFTKSIQNNPNNGEAWYELTQTFLASDNIPSADSLLKTVPAALEGDAMVKVAKGELLLHNENKDAAAKLFEEAIAGSKKKDQTGIMLKVAKAHVNTKPGDATYALQLLDEVVKRDKKSADAHLVRGNAYRKLADGGEAIKAYNTALEINNKLAEANYMIAKIYLSQDNQSVYLQNFLSAVEIDPTYRPALYDLYYYYYHRDVHMAKEYLDKVIANSDPSPVYDYMLADLMFVSGKHDDAINRAQEIIASTGEHAEPRLYKLMAYSFDAKQDSVKAKALMNEYFQKQPEENRVAKDYEFMGNLLLRFDGEEAEGVDNLAKAVDLDTSAIEKSKYINKLAAYYKNSGDRLQEAHWLGQAYKLNIDTSNTKLHEWGLAYFMGRDYSKSDSVFAIYTEKYPDQVYGYFWRARSNAAIDTSMVDGLAVPHYTKLAEVASVDTAQNKGLLIQAYGYLAAYNANTVKDYAKAVEHLEQILVLQPENAQARGNKEILEKLVNTAPKQTQEPANREKTNNADSSNGASK